MRAAVSYYSMFILVLMLSAAADAIAFTYPGPVTGAFLPIVLPFSACILCAFMLRLNVPVIAARTALLEVAFVTSLLLVPIFLGDFSITYDTFDRFGLGPVQVVNCFVVMFCFVLALFLSSTQVQTTFRIAFVIYVVSVLLDLYLNGPVQIAKGLRPGGFLINPNDGAAITNMLLIASFPWDKRTAKGALWGVVALPGVLPTLSRSGMFLWLLIMLAYTGTILLRSGSRSRMWIIAGLTVCVIGLATLLSFPTTTLVDEFGASPNIKRIATIIDLAHGNTALIKNDSRVGLLQYWSEKIPDKAFLGHGTEYSMSGFGPVEEEALGPHNMYVAMFVDEGMFGILALLSFFVFWLAFFLARRDTKGTVLVLSFAVVCLFSHNVASTTSMLTVIGVVAAEAVRNGNTSRLALSRELAAY